MIKMKCLTLVVLALCQVNCEIQLSEFQVYGPNAGDTNLASVIPNHADLDDGSSPELQLTTPFKFFDKTYQTLWVNVNGGVSFRSRIATYTPQCQVLGAEMAMISPFWADVDLRSDVGQAFYRQTTNASVLDKAKADIIKTYPDDHYDTLALKWAFVATWENVPFYDAVSGCYHSGLSNTFQLTLVTDGIKSFSLFYYNKIQWTTGSASGGAGCTGRGGSPARAGFDSGQGKMALIEGSCADDILKVTTRSTLGQPGKFVYRVDGTEILGPGGDTLATVTNTDALPTTPTATVSTHDSKRLQDVMDTINDTYTIVQELCPNLIEHPVLQKECFKEWIELDNIIKETNNANTQDELEQILKELDKIYDKLEDLKKDVTSKPLPPFTCSSSFDSRTKRRCEETFTFLEDNYALCQKTCPGLIDHPAVQQDCFDEWIKVDNFFADIRTTTTVDGFDLIYSDLTDIEKRLEKLRQDLGIH